MVGVRSRQIPKAAASGEGSKVGAMECACGHLDCPYLAAGYPFCAGCGDHHREPVTADASAECPVDVMFREYDAKLAAEVTQAKNTA